MFLFPGFPGGIELLVLFFVVILLFGIPLAIVALGILLLRGSHGDGDVGDEVRALREEVAELRATVRGDDEGTADEPTAEGKHEGTDDATTE